MLGTLIPIQGLILIRALSVELTFDINGRITHLFTCVYSLHSEKLRENTLRSAVDLLFQQLHDLQISIDTKQISPGPHDEREEASFALKQQRRTAETTLCDFLVFLRRVACSLVLRSRMACKLWVDLLMNIVRVPAKCGKQNVYSLRTRMLTLQLLETILPACSDQGEGGLVEMVCNPLKYHIIRV